MSTTYFIISAEKAGLEYRDNHRRTGQLQSQIASAGLRFTTVSGMYNGAFEVSLLIHPNGDPVDTVRKIIKEAARNFEQESVLEINRTGHAWLHYTGDGRQEFIGRMTVSKQVDPKKVSGYTSLPNGGYLHLEEENK
jgi:hypothetical protein